MWKCFKVLGFVLATLFLYSVFWFVNTSTQDAHGSSKERSAILQYRIIDVWSTTAPNPVHSAGDNGNNDDLVFDNSVGNAWGLSDGANQSKKYLVYTCSGKTHCGGWGDRLRGIFSTYVMAKVTNRIFILNMTSPCPLTTLVHPNEVLWNEKVDRNELSDEIFLETHDNERFAKMLQILDLSRFFRHSIIKLTPNYDLYPRLKMNPRYQKQLREISESAGYSHSLIPVLYKKLFILNQDLQFQVSEFLTKLYEYGTRRTLICFQVRMGRNPSIPRDTEVRTKPSQLHFVWDFLDEYKDIKRYKIFVTTDSELVRREAKERFPNQIIDTSGPISHPDFSRGNETCAALSKVILDQYVLRFCDTLVVSRSVFGAIGALLRQSDENLYQFKDGKISQKTLSDFALFVH